MKDIYLKFNSVTEFSNYLKNGETQPYFTNILSSQKEKNEGFNTCENYEEADNLMMFGDVDSMQKITEKRFNINNLNSGYKTTTRQFSQVCGGVVNVPSYLSGQPNCFVNRLKLQQKSKVVNFVVNIATSCNVSSDKINIVNRSILKSIIDTEKNGVRVNLYVCVFIKSNTKMGKNQDFGFIVKIKDSEHPINILKTAYFLGNSDFLRRHALRAIEITKGMSKDFTKDYGLPYTDEDSVSEILYKEFGLKDSIYLSTSRLCKLDEYEKEIEKKINK